MGDVAVDLAALHGDVVQVHVGDGRVRLVGVVAVLRAGNPRVAELVPAVRVIAAGHQRLIEPVVAARIARHAVLDLQPIKEVAKLAVDLRLVVGHEILFAQRRHRKWAPRAG